MRNQFLQFHHVTYRYDSMADPLFESLTCEFPIGWTGIVGPNGAGKTTLLLLATGRLKPDHGSIAVPTEVLYCEQRTDEQPVLLQGLLDATEGEAMMLKGKLGMETDWGRRWHSLSHGERKRAQLGVMIWQQPMVLAVDEPTNHIDAEARDMLRDALAAYRGIGLLVSHDRALLDGLCEQCLFLEPPEATMRPGGVTAGMGEAEREQAALHRERQALRHKQKQVERELVARREEASRAHKQRSKSGIAMRDHDAKAKKNLARITNKDGSAGKRLNQLQGRARQGEERLARTRTKKQHALGIRIQGKTTRRDTLFRVDGGSLPLGASRTLSFPDLLMRPGERVSLTGPNGTGKSTLLQHLVEYVSLPRREWLYMPQEIPEEAGRQMLAELRRLRKDRLADVLAIVRRLGSDPERLLQSESPSPGESRKIRIAQGIAEAPALIILDEPTNHLDLPSIVALEEALAECPCALLLVSHDHTFLGKLTSTHWAVERAGEDDGANTLNVFADLG